MTIARSEKSIEKLLPYLEAMYNSRGASELKWKVSPINPQTLARRLREAIYLSSTFEQYKKFGGLVSLYKIRVVGDYLITTPRYSTFESHSRIAEPTDVTQIYENEIDLVQLIGLLIQNKPRRIHFLKPKVAELELEKLYKWCVGAAPRYYILNHEEEGITLTMTNPEALEWKPQPEKSSSVTHPKQETTTAPQNLESLSQS